MLLLLKVILAPALIGIASILVSRLGSRLGGVISGLPVVTGPVLLLFALERGPEFAAQAASRTLLGTVSLLAYTSAYVGIARLHSGRWAPCSALLVGWCAFLLTAAALQYIPWPKAAGIPLAIGAIAMARPGFPRVGSSGGEPRPPLPSARMLAMRMGSAAVMVLSLSEAAARLGANWSGILSAFPVVSTVMLVATHCSDGLDVAVAYLRGFYLGLFGYVAFVVCITYLLVPCGVSAAFGIGVAVALGVQACLGWMPHRRRWG